MSDCEESYAAVSLRSCPGTKTSRICLRTIHQWYPNRRGTDTGKEGRRSSSRLEERALKDLTGVEVLQEVSQGQKWTNTVPFAGTRGIPWKVHTGTEDPRECTGHERESFRTVPTGEIFLGYCDNQGFSQGSYGMTNDYGEKYRGDNIVLRGNNTRNKTYSTYPTAPMEVREQLARDCFIDFLNDADLELEIFQRKNISIDDSVRIGHESEAFANGRTRKFDNRAG
ncbi:unnamed protein product [Mytilus coruscus]|uniref:Uncharacterized protein n=1 Tax=Mytilus coruscus TaxID=42192 RepID=A0A6J8BDA3_MYTCO|nr:unnamed protein product [Mytilus coruscus]